MLDQPGLDTELARLLHRLQRVDVKTLRGTLEEVRRTRPDAGPTLARLLVGRGIVTAAEVEPFLGGLHPAQESLDPGLVSQLQAQLDQDEVETRLIKPGQDPRSSQEPQSSQDDDSTVAVRSSSASGEHRLRPEPAGGWMPGSFAGAYVLERQAGAGGMGVVFIARHLETGRRYAIKTLRPTADEEMVARFRREGEAQGRVDGHPNVARVFGMGEAHGRLYLVMELAEGGDLAARVKRGLRSFVEAAGLVAGVARGLAHMHGCGVLHRDLKPGNILFDGAGVPKLVDFGLARFDDAQRLTLTGEVMGTPAFMSPEQTTGLRQDIGPWVDVWALGAVLFYALTGSPPFNGVGALEVMRQVAEEEPPRVRSQRPDVPAELDELVASVMNRDVERRPTAAQVATALERFVARAAGGATSVDLPAPASARGPLLAWFGLVAGASVVAAVSALVVVRGRATPADGPPPQATSTRPPQVVVTEPAPPPAPTTPAVLRWAQDEKHRWRLGCFFEATFEMPGMGRGAALRYDADLSLDLELTVVGVEPTRVTADGTISALRFRFKTAPTQDVGGVSPFAQDVAFDSRSSSDEYPAFRAAVGAKVYLAVDPRTGEVQLVDGMEPVQRQIYARAFPGALPTEAPAPGTGPEDGAREERRTTQQIQMFRHRLPIIGDRDGLKTLLQSVVHLLPPNTAVEPRTWTLRRANLGQGPMSAAWVDVALARDEAWTRFDWKGNRTVALPNRRDATLSRAIEGHAEVGPRGLLRAEVVEQVGGSQQGTVRTTLEVLP